MVNYNFKLIVLSSKEPSYDISKDYELKGTIGVGTYSQVKLGINISTGEEVAIKICRGDTSTELLKREMEIMKNLDWKFIPKIIDYKEDKVWKRAYLIMEKLNGVTLDNFLDKNPELNHQTILNFIYQIWLMIRDLHKSNICHRDIKPQNIIVTEDEKLKLIDFNISKTWKSDDDWKTDTKVFLTQISTPLYSAPEISLGSGYDESIDVWGIGMIAYLLIGGEIDEAQNWTFSKNKSHTINIYRKFIEESTNVSDQTKDFLLHWLEEDPSKRVKWTDPIFDSMIEYCSEVINGAAFEEFKSE